MDNGEEVRVTNEQTGGAKGQKLARYGLIPVEPLNEVAKLYGAGAAKYADNNWALGYKWSLSYDALQRHLNAFWAGEYLDEETGLPHLAAAVFHCFTLMHFNSNHPEMDDRLGPLRAKEAEQAALEKVTNLGGGLAMAEYATGHPMHDLLSHVTEPLCTYVRGGTVANPVLCNLPSWRAEHNGASRLHAFRTGGSK